MTYLLIAWLLQPSAFQKDFDLIPLVQRSDQTLRARTDRVISGRDGDAFKEWNIAAGEHRPIAQRAVVTEVARRQQELQPFRQRFGFLGANGREVKVRAHPVSIKPIALAVSPQLGVAPTVLTVQAHLTPIASDRLVQVVIESETFYRSFECQLEGEQSPKYCPDLKAFSVWIRSPGAYTIVAGIGSSAERIRAVDRTTVEIR